MWSDANDIKDIKCYGLVHSITVNLVDALRRFRSPHKVKRLWADALCINQHNEEEKGHQATHIDKVYENATCVLVWLSSDDGVAEDCFRMVKAVNNQFEGQVSSNERFDDLQALRPPYPIPMDRKS